MYLGMMSEMLGNYHFLIRNYQSAIIELENVQPSSPDYKKACKKLIICYSQTGQLQRAFNLFCALVEEDINFIIHTDPEKEDCPCPELVTGLEVNSKKNFNVYELNIELGMLWLYCNAEKSLDYFRRAYQIKKTDARLKSIITQIESVITHHN